MLDLLLSSLVTTSQVQIVAQATTVYLPISTTQSNRPNCVTYTATNSTRNIVRDVNLNRRNREGKIIKYSLSNLLAYGFLKAGETVAFDMCDNSFVNVEAKQ